MKFEDKWMQCFCDFAHEIWIIADVIQTQKSSLSNEMMCLLSFKVQSIINLLENYLYFLFVVAALRANMHFYNEILMKIEVFKFAQNLSTECDKHLVVVMTTTYGPLSYISKMMCVYIMIYGSQSCIK